MPIFSHRSVAFDRRGAPSPHLPIPQTGGQ